MKTMSFCNVPGIACLILLSIFMVATLAAPTPGDYGGHGGFGGGHLGGHGGYGGHHGYRQEYYGPAHYGFQYGVHDPHHGANFGHQEEREGYTTRGSYYVNLPDGRLQKVEYIADEHGYRPIVSYEGHAHYPSHGGYGGHHGGGY
ncbi:adult-specific cuticular protein ACP-20 [Hyalella azteca]|uniref:Adult-specific cuticular protein ACP-20 n=1 Tax=Hyalella azteca TaxID=294128 RepID=A0A8B7NX90_HYAAZ|nr:adult-specific cuticular protein ACP-20 [Hyalella azteca]